MVWNVSAVRDAHAKRLDAQRAAVGLRTFEYPYGEVDHSKRYRLRHGRESDPARVVQIPTGHGWLSSMMEA